MISPDREDRPASTPESRKKALAIAANVLTYKNRSAAALYDRLLEKEIGEEDAAYAVARLIELGFLNDETYGRHVVEQCRAKGWGRSRIAQELKKKQLDAELIGQLLEDFEPDYDKMQKLIAAKLKGDPNPDRAALKKVSDSLARKGFSWAQIKQALSNYSASFGDDEDYGQYDTDCDQ